jgi:flagellar basal-body rod protein FlgG
MQDHLILTFLQISAFRTLDYSVQRITAYVQDLLYTTLRSAGSASKMRRIYYQLVLQIGAGAAVLQRRANNIQGTLIQTGTSSMYRYRVMDIFNCQLADGTLAYTRNGQFRKSATGQIVTQSGNVVAVQA